jgi:DinB superfamily
MKTLIAGLGFVLVAASASAQAGNPIGAALTTEAKTNETNMTGAAEAMPAEKFAYKPTPDQNSFAQLIFHAADANFRLCSMMSGDKAPEASVKADGAKQALIDQMKQSFAFCYQAFDKIDAAKLGTQVKFGNRDVSIAWVALHTALDWGDHYSQVATMLRLNGITPPSAQRRPR